MRRDLFFWYKWHNQQSKTDAKCFIERFAELKLNSTICARFNYSTGSSFDEKNIIVLISQFWRGLIYFLKKVWFINVFFTFRLIPSQEVNSVQTTDSLFSISYTHNTASLWDKMKGTVLYQFRIQLSSFISDVYIASFCNSYRFTSFV